MATRTWTLFDQASPTSGADATDLPAGVDFVTLEHGLSIGVDVVKIDNGKLAIHVLPTRGMNIWKAFWQGNQGTEVIGWNAPVRGPVHPQFVPLSEPSGLGWLDGFDELLARCGLESNGAPEFDEATGRLKHGLHGRISNKPAHKVELMLDDVTGEIELTGWVEDVRLHFLKASLKATLKTQIGSAGFEIVDEITNLSANPAEIQMLYHVNFGEPLLDAGSQVVAPISELVPRNERAATGISTWDSYVAATPGFEEQVYLAKLQSADDGSSMSLLKNAHGTRGAVLRFNTKQLPCFTVWKNTAAVEDGYVTGMEPGTNFPNPRSFEGERGRVIELAAHGSATLNLGFEYCGSEAAVNAAEGQVKMLQVRTPTIHPNPLDDWCAP